MKTTCWYTPAAGALQRLRMVEQSTGDLSPHEMRVAVAAAGLNFADIFALTGLYSATPRGGFVPGLEFAGTLVGTGEQAHGFQVGDRVMGVTRFGGYASVIDVQPAYLRPLPAEWSFAQGAAYPVQTLTAWYALVELGNLKPGQRVLVHSAAGGVGLQAMQLVRALGADPVGTVGDERKVSFLQSLGFDDILVREPDFAAQLARDQKTFDLVLDAIGGAVQAASFVALRPAGRMVVFGAAEFAPGGNRPRYLHSLWRYLRRPRYDVLSMISRNRSIMAFNLIWLWEQVELLSSLMNDMGRIHIPPPHVGHEFPFGDAPAALEYLRSGQSLGKVVLRLD